MNMENTTDRAEQTLAAQAPENGAAADGQALDGPLKERYEELLERLRRFKRLAVAFSGGIDSTLLLHAATQALGAENTLGIIASSETLTPAEYQNAQDLAERQGYRLRTLEYSELSISGYSENPVDRCYHCKHELFSRLLELARAEGIETLADGSSHEDLTDDYRPGMRAARELGVVSPLMELKMRKDDIRAIANALGLPNWNKPSAACLASRFPYGTPITRDRLDQVAQAEAVLRDRGFSQLRVRWHDSIARIEVAPDEIPKMLDETVRNQIVEKFKEIGFRYIALDLQGYRTGSLNEGLGLKTGD